jgi:hypothetical protein
MELSEEPRSKYHDEVDLKESQNDANHDCVFGEITEEGPNYRNVCTTYLLKPPEKPSQSYSNFHIGGSIGNCNSNDENANWPGSSCNTDYI